MFSRAALGLHFLPNAVDLARFTVVFIFSADIVLSIAGLGGAVGCASDWLSGVAGWIPVGSGNILSWRLILKYFLRLFSPCRCLKRGSFRFLAKECAQVLVNRLED